MTVQFTRSVRSIQADSLGPMLVGAIFFTVLMLGWLFWLFFATIPNYENSSTATLQRDGYVMAGFSSTAFNRLRRGQSGQFLPGTSIGNATAIPLVVTDLYPESGRVRLILRVESEEVVSLQSDMTGEVKITVEELSPATMVLRSAGLLPKT